MIIRLAVASTSHQVVKAMVLITLIAIIVAGMFMHVFERPIIQIVVVSCIFFLAYCCLEEHDSHRKLYLVFIACCTPIIALHIGAQVRQLNYSKAFKLYLAGLLKESKEELLQMGPVNDEYRSVLYLQILLQSHDLTAEEEIKSILNKFPNSHTFKMLGDYYAANHEYQKAESAYITSIHMVPNRFVPRQSLLKMYIEQERGSAVRSLATEILSLKVKVGSYQITQIKKEAKQILNKY